MGGAKLSWARWLAGPALLACAPACTLLPGELNLSPLYRHRLAGDGTVLEMDVLWPVFFYRRTEDGGVDFRVRPLYRYVEPGDEAGSEHQFLVPFGRVAHGEDESLSRLFPLWWHRRRPNEVGDPEVDWYVALLVWGGSAPGEEDDYFAVLPFYADIPGFLSYDRYQMHMFPVHLGLKKDDRESHGWIWPFVGWGSDDDGEWYWHRVLPLYAVAVDENEYRRYAVLWPFFNWGVEELDTPSPVRRFFVFPLFGRQTSEDVDGWTVLWPFFKKLAIGDHLLRLDVLWPFFRWFRDEEDDILQWWLWPLVGRTVTPTQRTWNFLWPLVWAREYDDPEGPQSQLWILPFFWHVHRDRADGTEDDYLKVWPVFHREIDHDGEGEWQLFSPWPYRAGLATGVDEAYGWLWTLAERSWEPDGSSFDLAAHLFTTERRGTVRQTSVPFLFNYTADTDGEVLRLFQFLPIRLGGPPSGGEEP